VIVRNDPKWTPIFIRPRVFNEKISKMLEENTSKIIDEIYNKLREFLNDGEKFSLIAPTNSLELDFLAWIVGSVTSIGLRLAAGFAGSGWLSIFSERPDGNSLYMRLMGVLGVLVGAAVAGWVKRRNPGKGNAFFEGLIVAIANITLSVFLYKPIFSMGMIDWVIYFIAGVSAAYLIPSRKGAKKE